MPARKKSKPEVRRTVTRKARKAPRRAGCQPARRGRPTAKPVSKRQAKPPSAASRYPVGARDKQLLRELGKRVAETAVSPLNAERRRLWYAHDRGERVRPLVVTETDGGLQLVQPDFKLECEAEWLRGYEHRLRDALIHYELLQDDRVVEPRVNCGWHVDAGGYGVDVKIHRGTDLQGGHTGYRWEPPILDLEAEFGRLKPRTFSVDRARSEAEKDALHGIFDGVLEVRRRGSFWWTMGLTQTAIFLVGLEQFMVCMCEAPEALHRLMAFLRDDHLAFVDWLEREHLLSLNNENDYVGSGSFGYCTDLPQAVPQSSRLRDGAAGAPVRARDLWVQIESQETSGVGPAQYGEFVFPYHEAMARRFGKVYYGCCEAVDGRWEYLPRLPNLKRISISPWANEEVMAERLAHGRYVYSRKPAPALISTQAFDEETIRADLWKTAGLIRKHDLIAEFSMKDVHTLSGDPPRLPRWVQLAREEIGRCAG
jgi:hypothetical protein